MSKTKAALEAELKDVNVAKLNLADHNCQLQDRINNYQFEVQELINTVKTLTEEVANKDRTIISVSGQKSGLEVAIAIMTKNNNDCC